MTLLKNMPSPTGGLGWGTELGKLRSDIGGQGASVQVGRDRLLTKRFLLNSPA